MKHYYLCLLWLPLGLLAQNETVHVFQESYREAPFSRQLYGDQLLVVAMRQAAGLESDLWRVSLSDGMAQPLLQGVAADHHSIRYGSEGVFFVSWETSGQQLYYLNYLGVDGASFQSVRMGFHSASSNNQSYAPRHPNLFQGKYYVNSYHYGHTIWETDGRAEGTRMVYRTSSLSMTIKMIDQAGGRLIFVTEAPSEFQLWSYSGAGEPSAYLSLDKAGFSSDFAILGRDGDYLYFNAEDSGGQKAVWRTDGTAGGTAAFLEGYQAHSLHFDERGFTLETKEPHLYWSTVSRYYRGDTEAPQALTLVEYAPGVDDPTAVITRHLGGNHFVLRSAKYGLETARINEAGQFELWQDLMPGPASALPWQANQSNAHRHLLAPEGLYIGMTNGNDPSYHLYFLDEAGAFPVFRLDDFEAQLHFFQHGNWIYWFHNQEGALSLSRHPNQRSAPSQAAMPALADTWFRELAFLDTLTGVGEPGSLNRFLRPQGAWIDQAGNVIVGFGSDSWNARLGISHTDSLLPLNGYNVYAKFSPYGELLWAKSLGHNDYSWSHNNYKLAIDQHGDLLILGIYYQAFTIDGLTIGAANTYGQFVAKLDGQTGAVRWVRNIAATSQLYKLRLDGILADRDDNIYVAVTHEGAMRIGGYHLSAAKGRAHALLKLSPEGQSLWAKTIETPWQSNLGRTLVFAYDDVQHTIWAAQSEMDFASSSSCRFRPMYSLIRAFDMEGETLRSRLLSSDDHQSLSAGAASPDGSFFAAGYFRGKMQLDRFRGDTRSCTGFEGYHFRLDGQSTYVTDAWNTQGEPFYPLQAKAHGGYLYVYGAEGGQGSRLTLLKLDAEGRLIGIKRLGQRTEVFRQGSFERFDVRDGYIVVVGNQFSRDPRYGIAPLFPTAPAVALLRIPDADWEEPDGWYAPMRLDWPYQNEQISFFPNPTSGMVYAFLQDATAASSYQRYEVWDMQGRSVAAGRLDIREQIEINVEGLLPGTYFLQLSGPQGVVQGKIIRQP
jgi:hypothetical protein